MDDPKRGQLGLDRRDFLKTLGAGAIAAVGLPLASLARLAPLPRGPMHGPFVPPWVAQQPNGAPEKFYVNRRELEDIKLAAGGPAAPPLDTSWEYDVREGFTSHPSSVTSRIQVYLNGVHIGLCVAANPATGHVLVYSKRVALDVNRDWIAEEEGPCRCEDKRWHIPARFRNGTDWCVPIRVIYGDVEVRHV